ncbi:MAG: enoyl-CoA hydratase-related protein [Chloroflexota bacterium]
MTPNYKHLLFTTENGVCRITLNRPELHNAFNRELIDELRGAFESIADMPTGDVRAVVLSGAGKSFCAGADVNWMGASLDFTEEENVADALRMARMFETIDTCPVPLIGRLHGAALGGGVGLAAVCDIAVAAEGTMFAFSEAKLGIAPAVISPYVLSKIGRSHARALFLTAERFGTDRAMHIGLIHSVKLPEEIDAEIERLVNELRGSAPGAVTRAKMLIGTVPQLAPEQAMQYTAETIASLRVGEEGQDGLRAFLEKRKPGWVQ